MCRRTGSGGEFVEKKKKKKKKKKKGKRKRVRFFSFFLFPFSFFLSMRNIKLTIRYDGTDFFGWQTQPGKRTVQETLEGAIAEITREERVRVNVSGRTDSGVHAVAQSANVYTSSALSCETLLKAINAKLPDDVSVRETVEVPQSFCANKDAL